MPTSSRRSARNAAGLPDDHPLIGHQRPRIVTAAYSESTAADEAIALAAHAGLPLDDWQQFVLTVGMGEDPDGLWTSLEVAVILSRQNGKGAVIEARQLAGLFLFDEEVQIFTAHEVKTALNQMRRIVKLINQTPDLKEQVKAVKYSHGEEGIYLKDGRQLLFMARTDGSGRGFSGDTVYLDEAMILGSDSVAALLPTLSARPNPQIWYFGSAGIGAKSVHLGSLRRRGIKGEPGLAFLEWSAELCTSECRRGCRKHDDPKDPRTWAKANPALGIRITPGFVEKEQRAMSAIKFAQERLGVGDYPVEEGTWEVISKDAWEAIADVASQVVGTIALSADIPPERTSGAIAIAGKREDGLLHGEVIAYRTTGIGWMVDEIVRLCLEWGPCVVVIDAAGPAGTLIAPLKARFIKLGIKIEIVTPTSRDVGAAYGSLVTSATDTKDLRQRDQAPLNSALAGAKTRDIGDVKAWARKNATVDISPLVSFTNALWGFANYGHLPKETVIEGDLMA